MAMLLNRGSLVGRLQVPKYVAIVPEHGEIAGRDEPDQHPIEAISGLREELDNMRELIMTNEEDNIDKDDVASDAEAEDVIEDVFDGIPEPGDDDDIATDEEVNDAIEDVFGEGSTEEPPVDDNPPSGDTPAEDDNVASDEEVDEVIKDIFG